MDRWWVRKKLVTLLGGMYTMFDISAVLASSYGVILYQWIIVFLVIGGRYYITPKRRQGLYLVYKRYILPIGWLYTTDPTLYKNLNNQLFIWSIAAIPPLRIEADISPQRCLHPWLLSRYHWRGSARQVSFKMMWFNEARRHKNATHVKTWTWTKHINTAKLSKVQLR